MDMICKSSESICFSGLAWLGLPCIHSYIP